MVTRYILIKSSMVSNISEFIWRLSSSRDFRRQFLPHVLNWWKLCTIIQNACPRCFKPTQLQNFILGSCHLIENKNFFKIVLNSKGTKLEFLWGLKLDISWNSNGTIIEFLNTALSHYSKSWNGSKYLEIICKHLIQSKA